MKRNKDTGIRGIEERAKRATRDPKGVTRTGRTMDWPFGEKSWGVSGALAPGRQCFPRVQDSELNSYILRRGALPAADALDLCVLGERGSAIDLHAYSGWTRLKYTPRPRSSEQ